MTAAKITMEESVRSLSFLKSSFLTWAAIAITSPSPGTTSSLALISIMTPRPSKAQDSMQKIHCMT